jgi:hypothetical protein
MNIGTTSRQAVDDAKAKAALKVDALPNLTDAQRAHVKNICVGYVETHSGGEPSYEGIADHVRRTVKS